MALTAADILNDARTLLIDPNKVRWPDAELIDWINDGARQCVLLKPDCNPVTQAFSCAAGAKQTLPTGTVMLFDIPANDGGVGAAGSDRTAITFVKRNVLDSERPNWRNDTEAAKILYYMYDEWQRDIFYVYPPALATTSIDIITAAEPTLITVDTDALPIQDIYAPALVNYVVWRAYSKDSDFSGNLELSAGYYQAFVQALTGKMAAETSEAPARNIPPNIASR